MMKCSVFLSVLLVSFLSFVSAEALAAGPAQPQTPQPLTEEEVRAFLKEYTEAYMAGDLDRYMALFSRGAIENRMYAYNDIRQGYGKQFRQSKAVKFELTVGYIQTYPRSAYVSGRYVLTQTPKGWGRAKVQKGAIQFELVRENGSLRIKELNYGILE